MDSKSAASEGYLRAQSEIRNFIHNYEQYCPKRRLCAVRVTTKIAVRRGATLANLERQRPSNADSVHGLVLIEQTNVAYSLLLTSENMAPRGSWPWIIQPPPGTCIGPLMIFPPPDSTRLTAAQIESTLK